MSFVGNLEDLGLGEILQIVCLSRKTGILELSSRGRDGFIEFRDGQVVRASSSAFQQGLGEVLIQKGLTDLPTLRKALARQQADGFRERLGIILVKYFGLSQETVEDVVREQIEKVVFYLFAWAEGSFKFDIRKHVETVDDTHLDPLQFMLDQGLNTQYLAMEGTRILDEMRRDGQPDSNSGEAADAQAVDFDYALVDKDITPADLPHLPKPPVVIVDDDGPTLRAIGAALQSLGYEVHAMHRSEDTLIKVDNLFRSGGHPVILVDLIMPKMDGSGVLGGVELLEMLHNNFRKLFVVIMSDYHHTEAELKIRDLGCSFIMKPRRGEIGNFQSVQEFVRRLIAEISPKNSDKRDFPVQDHFRLGDELRLELDDNHGLAPSTDFGTTSELSLLRGMLEELNNPDLQGGVPLLVLRYASEFLNRAVVFTVNGSIVSGIGQFGILSSTVNGDEVVRAMNFPLESADLFREACRTCRSVRLKPEAATDADAFFFEQLGGGLPEESFIAPIISQSRVIGFLYGDNLPVRKPVGDTETLEIFLSQAGIAMDKTC